MRHAIGLLAATTVLFSTCASAAVIRSNTNYTVVDGREAMRSFRVNAIGIVDDVNISVEFAKCDDPPIGPEGGRCQGRGIPFEDEFTLALIAPDGTRVDLVQAYTTYDTGTAGSSVGRVGVRFDDEAASAAGPRIRAGSFRPARALAAFDGMDMFGSWTLYMQDFFPGDPFEFFSARLEIAPDENGAVVIPVPGTPALLGLGLVGLLGLRSRHRVVSAPRSA